MKPHERQPQIEAIIRREVSVNFRARRVRFQLRRCGSTGILVATSPSAMAFSAMPGV